MTAAVKFDSHFLMTIDGRSVPASTTIDVFNPATGTAFAAAPNCAREQLDLAVEAAQQAFETWRSVPLEDRQALVRRAAKQLVEHVGPLSHLFTREQGRPLEGARREIEGAARWLKAVSQMTPPLHIEREPDGDWVETHYVPLGPVCAIAPWNFPVALAMWKFAPALVAGNTIVLKPSPYTPLCTLKIGELLADIFPPGVINVISGGDELGPRMTDHPGFAKIAFTGSTATGKRVLQSAARDLKRVTLELGGNDAAIVLPDVDLDRSARPIFFSAFFNTGQICVATKRLYIHADIYEALRDRLIDIAAQVKSGDGADPCTVLGPVQNEAHFRRLKALLEDARAHELTLIQPGETPTGGGYFVPLTLVDNPPETSRVVQEEAFGPILPLLKFTDIDDVIRRANASDYGLAASVWSRDVERALQIARRLEAGTVWINQHLKMRPDIPFAGHKHSGLGVENGLHGLLEYMTPRALYVTSGEPAGTGA